MVSEYQSFLDRMATSARRDVRLRKQETVGRVLYAVIVAALASAFVCLVLRNWGLLP